MDMLSILGIIGSSMLGIGKSHRERSTSKENLTEKRPKRKDKRNKHKVDEFDQELLHAPEEAITTAGDQSYATVTSVTKGHKSSSEEKLPKKSKKKDKYKKHKGSKNKLKQTAKQCISSKTADDDSETELIKPEDEESLHCEETTTAEVQPHQSPTQITTVATVETGNPESASEVSGNSADVELSKPTGITSSGGQRVIKPEYLHVGDIAGQNKPNPGYRHLPNKTSIKAKSYADLPANFVYKESSVVKHYDEKGNVLTMNRSISLQWSPQAGLADQQFLPQNNKAKITKIGMDCWYDDNTDSLFEEMLTKSAFPVGAVLHIEQIGRNTWQSEEKHLFQKLCPPYRNQTANQVSIQPMASCVNITALEDHTASPRVLETGDDFSINSDREDQPEDVSLGDGDSLDSIHFILGGSNELQINPGSCEDTFDDSQQTWSNSPDEDATERVAEGITEPPNIKDSNWSRHQTQQPLQMINQSQPRLKLPTAFSGENMVGSDVDTESNVSKLDETIQEKPAGLLFDVVASDTEDVSSYSDDEECYLEGGLGRLTNLPEICLENVMGDLQKCDRKPRTPTDFEDFIHDVAVLCESEPAIKSPVCLQDHLEPRKVLLQGPNMSKVEGRIQKLIEEKFPNYSKTVISEKEPEFYTDNGLPVYTNHLVGQKFPARVPYYLEVQRCTNRRNNMWVTHKLHATCGVFLRAEALPKPKAGGDTFTMSSYHALFFDNQGEKIADGDEEKTDNVWESIVGETKTRSRLTLRPHNHEGIQIKETPLGNYRQYIPKGADLLWHEKFMADEVVFRTSRKQLLENKWSGQSLQTHVDTPVDNGVSKPIPIAGIIPIREPRHIGFLLDVKVSCDGIAGIIQPHPTTIQRKDGTQAGNPQMVLAHHIAFTAVKPLRPGTSGSPVFVYDEKNECMYIIAILMGSFEYDEMFGTSVMYQAIPLYPALQRMEVNFPTHIRGIRLEAQDALGKQDFKQSIANLTKAGDDTGYFDSIRSNNSSGSSSGPSSAPPQLTTPRLSRPADRGADLELSHGASHPALSQLYHSTPKIQRTRHNTEHEESYSGAASQTDTATRLTAPEVPPRRNEVSSVRQGTSQSQHQPYTTHSIPSAVSPTVSSIAASSMPVVTASTIPKRSGGPIPSNNRGPVPSNKR